MSEDTMPHATSAPDDVQHEAGVKMNELRETSTKDALGRANWLDISRAMKEWWKGKGYAYP